MGVAEDEERGVMLHSSRISGNAISEHQSHASRRSRTRRNKSTSPSSSLRINFFYSGGNKNSGDINNQGCEAAESSSDRSGWRLGWPTQSLAQSSAAGASPVPHQDGGAQPPNFCVQRTHSRNGNSIQHPRAVFLHAIWPASSRQDDGESERAVSGHHGHSASVLHIFTVPSRIHVLGQWPLFGTQLMQPLHLGIDEDWVTESRRRWKAGPAARSVWGPRKYSVLSDISRELRDSRF